VLGTYLWLVPWAHGTELIFDTQDFAPFNYAIEGVVSGPAADIIRHICSDMHISCSFNLLPWPRAQQEVREGLAQGLFVIGWNAERATWLYFSPPILTTEYGFFVRNDNPLQFKDVADVQGYRVGVYGPSNTSKALEKIQAQVPDMTIEMRPDDEAGFKKLALGRVDAVFSNRDVGKYLIAKLGLQNIHYAGVQQQLHYYIGFSQQFTDKRLVNQFNTTFRTLYKRGIIRKILAQYTMEVATLDGH
jgi:polar amino acid transport system substrate-binding protein